MRDHPIVARRREQASDFGLFEQLNVRQLAKQIAHRAFEQAATRKQSAYSRERQRRSPTSRRHQRRIKTETDPPRPALVHQAVEPRTTRPGFWPAALDPGLER